MKRQPLLTLDERELLRALKASQESALDAEVRRYLESAKASGLVRWFVRVEVKKLPGRGGSRPNVMKGFPDFMGVTTEGRFFVIEDKSKKGKLSKEQVEWRERITACPLSIYVEARHVEDVRRAIAGMEMGVGA